jgi:hypothetical protein
MAQLTDARHTRPSAAEVKFLVDPGVGAAIRAWARARLSADPHGGGEFGDEYRTSSLYFDTPAYDVFYRRGSFGHSKYRVRRYDCQERVFLERKRSRPGFVAKRRTPVGLETLERLGQSGPDQCWMGEWFRRSVEQRRLRPVCQISYQRTARVGRAGHAGEESIRLTMDEHLRAAPSHGLAFSSDSGTAVLGDQLILELKYAGDMPAAFVALVDTFGLVAQSASKYRLSVVALGYVQEPSRM